MVPLALELLDGAEGVVLDLGCGEGQLLRALEAVRVVGCDLSLTLLRTAVRTSPAVRCRLPELGWVKPGAFDGAACVFVLEHLADVEALFSSVANAVRSGGIFVVVMNHPSYTADGAGPVIDMSDGEVLWRWGDYFEPGASTEPAGSGSVTFYHRPLDAILNAAAAGGFILEEAREVGLAPDAVARDPGFAGQEHLPRLLGVRWRRR